MSHAPLVEHLKSWVAEHQAPLSSDGIDVSLVVMESEGARAAAILYAETQDDSQDLTGRLMLQTDLVCDVEILDVESGEALHAAKASTPSPEQLERVVDDFIGRLRKPAA